MLIIQFKSKIIFILAKIFIKMHLFFEIHYDIILSNYRDIYPTILLFFQNIG